MYKPWKLIVPEEINEVRIIQMQSFALLHPSNADQDALFQYNMKADRARRKMRGYWRNSVVVPKTG